jgi:hypothetical protein
MNLKFSQFKPATNLVDSDVLPILRTNDNYAISALSIFNYMSGNKFNELYTSYQYYSSVFLGSNSNANSVFSTYSNNSSFYVTTNAAQTISGIKTFFDSSFFKTSLSSVVIYTPNGNSNNWNVASTYVFSNSASIKNVTDTVSNSAGNWSDTYSGFSQLSSIAVVSDITNTPSATAIKNIIAITQTTYDNLIIKDPYTFYIIS